LLIVLTLTAINNPASIRDAVKGLNHHPDCGNQASNRQAEAE
jgi:hypothetical protein